ncbi:MAG: PPOX class F420-dependent oxidoreductase [Chloroflexi bacterium]|nr:PPOX class F420-dependent oxidoreductase [Chloroflexota bacterium]
MSLTLPESHRDLFERPVVVALATVNPNGQPQVTPVWVDYDGQHLIINTARGRRKDRNMEARPQVTVMAMDPDDPYRWIEVRGVIEAIDEASGLEVINRLSAKYRNQPDYYARNEAMRGKETRVTYRIRPTHITKGG